MESKVAGVAEGVSYMSTFWTKARMPIFPSKASTTSWEAEVLMKAMMEDWACWIPLRVLLEDLGRHVHLAKSEPLAMKSENHVISARTHLPT
eukprot:17675_1